MPTIPCFRTPFPPQIGSLLGKGMSFIKTPTSVIASLFSTATNTPRISLQELNENNINVIDALTSFREALEEYNPGIIQGVFTDFQQDYELYKDNTTVLKKQLSETLKKFEKICEKILKKERSDQKKNAIETSFKKFLIVFKALIDPSSLDAQAIESVQLIKSKQLHNQLNQVITYLESKKIDAQPWQDLQNEFNYDENKNNPILYENTLKKFIDISNAILKIDFQPQQKVEIEHFLGKILLDPWQIAFDVLLEFNETIIEARQLQIELDKVVSYVKKEHSSIKEITLLQDLRNQFDLRHSNKNSKTTPTTIMRGQLLDAVAEASAILELFISEKIHSSTTTRHKNTQKIILKELEKIISLIKKDSSSCQEMRFYFSDAPVFETLKKRLQDLPKENPTLFTKRQKVFLDSIQREICAISYGKTFNKKDLQEKLYQCYDVIKETLPDTLFTQTTDLLCDLESCVKNTVSASNSRKIADGLTSLNSFINNPRLFPSNEITLEELSIAFSSLDFDPAANLLDSLANTHNLFQPNQRAFKELKNKYSGMPRPDGKSYPNFQKELDSLYPFKRTAFKRLKKIIPNQETADFLRDFINSSDIPFQPEEKAQLENLHKNLCSIIPNPRLSFLLDEFIHDPNIPCRASAQTFESVKEKLSSAGIPSKTEILCYPPIDEVNCLYPLKEAVFEDLQTNLSSIIPDQATLNLLSSLIDSPNIPPNAKEVFKKLRKNLSSLDQEVLNCLYPLEKSVFTGLKNNLYSFRQEALNFFNNNSTFPFKIDAERIRKLRDNLRSTPDQRALEFLDGCINDPNTNEEKKQAFESLRNNLSSLRRELDYSDSITQEELKHNLLAITPNKEILHSLAVVIEDPSIPEEGKQVFKGLKRHLSSIDLEVTSLVRSFEQAKLKEPLSSTATQILHDVNSCIHDPRIPPDGKLLLKDLKDNLVSIQQNMATYLHSIEKSAFENLIERLSSIAPNQNISQEDSMNLKIEFNKCRKIVEEMKTHTPLKEKNKIAIEQELQKLARHATNLSFMMLIDKTLFRKNRDSFFYRTIIQKAEETSSCPKKLLLVALENAGAPKWKIRAAKVCFFITKYLGIERYVHKIILRVITNYSKCIYQRLEHEYHQDQFYSLIQRIIENATTYFQLLGPAISNAKEAAQTEPDQLTALIIKQLLLLKPQEDETTLKELNLKALYTKLADDLIEKSESRLIKWLAWLKKNHKHTLISSIIEAGTDSLLNPTPDEKASTINVLLRDGLKTLYKKLPSLANEDSSSTISKNLPILATSEELQLLTTDGKSKLLKINKLADLFVENFIKMFNEYQSIQQLTSLVNTIATNEKHIEYLKTQSIPLQGMIDSQIEEFEKKNDELKLKVNALANPALPKEAVQSASLFPIIEDIFVKTTHPWKLLSTDKHAKSTLNIAEQEAKKFIRPIVVDIIRKELTFALTKLLEQPFPEDFLYDMLYQIAFLTNQSIQQPKENKEMQKDVNQEIAELIEGDSFAISSSVLPSLVKKYTGIRQLAELTERHTPNFVPSLISSVVRESFQNAASLTGERALFQPEALVQLGRRIILPIAAA